MPSRRQILATLGSGVAVSLAGCSGSGSGGSDTVDCHTHALAHGDGDLLDGGASATVEDGDVRLAVPLSVDDVEATGADTLEVVDAAGRLAHVIPISAGDAGVMANKVGVGDGHLRYEQYLGERPFHGEYTVRAVDVDDEVIDTITIEFNCFPDVDDAES